MKSTACTPDSNPLSHSAQAEENALLREQVQGMQRQLDWFKKQLFGPKSEKQVYDLPGQDSLFQQEEAPVPEKGPQEDKRTVRAYQRGTAKKQRDDDCLNDTGLRFSADVPVEVVEHLPPELTGPDAVRPLIGWPSDVVLKCERPVFRCKGTEKPVTAPAPPNVLDNSLADVSLLAGLLVDKFQFHLPLYRRHQRIQQAGVIVSRSADQPGQARHRSAAPHRGYPDR